MNRRRSFYALLGITAWVAILAGRLLWLQLVETAGVFSQDDHIVPYSASQRTREIILDSGRGHIFDRNGERLTGESIHVLASFPLSSGKRSTEDEAKLARILHTTRDKIELFIYAREPKIWSTSDRRPVALTPNQMNAVRALQWEGVEVVPYIRRYPDPYWASHVIGYISENPQKLQQLQENGGISYPLKDNRKTQFGSSGLEKTMDVYLHGIGPTTASYIMDGKKTPLQGLGLRMFTPKNAYYPLNIITTLDRRIQMMAEDTLDRFGVKRGAVVVLDAHSGDVVAMASRPSYDPLDIDPQSEDWNNRAIKGLVPGSVFKTVTAAAALEEGLTDPNERFECKGHLGKYGLSCWNKEGHGWLTLTEAYAQSCNIAFARLSERLTGEQLEAYASILGAAGKVGWQFEENQRQFDAENAGQVFAATTDREDGGVKAQTAIGQRDVLMTPLQAANMVVTLLHGGKAISPRIVTEVRYADGSVMKRFTSQDLSVKGDRSLSRETSLTLLKLMSEVVRHGTGRRLQQAVWPLAGKSGTAEIGSKDSGRVNQWFVGYGPVDAPKYTVSVVVENAPSIAKPIAAPLFLDLMNELGAR